MTERIHTWFVGGALFILAVGVIGWRSLSGSSARVPGAAIPNPGLRMLTPYAAPLSDTLSVRRPMVDSMTLRRDPFASQRVARIAQVGPAIPTETKVDEPKWNVSAILIGGARRAAIINDELVHVGESLPGGVKLTSVERDRVVLTDSRGTAHTIAVKEGEG